MVLSTTHAPHSLDGWHLLPQDTRWVKTMLLACYLIGELSDKEPVCLCRRYGFHPWVGISPGEGNGNPLQYSCLWNLLDRGAWPATVNGVTRVGHHLGIKTPPIKSKSNKYHQPLTSWGELLWRSRRRTSNNSLGECGKDGRNKKWFVNWYDTWMWCHPDLWYAEMEMGNQSSERRSW